jgi:RHS repeat-associated protein
LWLEEKRHSDEASPDGSSLSGGSLAVDAARFKLIEQDTGEEGDYRYVIVDQIGTPQAATDRRGNLVWRAVYDPFGAAAVDSDPDGDGAHTALNLRFSGQYFDAETGLHDNYFRSYSPEGRYLQSDPIGMEGGVNTYAYVGGNPLSNQDPWGLSSVGAYGECKCGSNISKHPNYFKLQVSLGNFATGTWAVALGASRIVVGVGLTPATATGAGAAPPGYIVSMGVWNVNSGVSAWNRGFKTWDEAWCEDPRHMSPKNFWGLAPAGTEFDDPDEPSGPMSYMRETGWWNFIKQSGLF